VNPIRVVANSNHATDFGKVLAELCHAESDSGLMSEEQVTSKCWQYLNGISRVKIINYPFIKKNLRPNFDAKLHELGK
jgi:hypothetical protein